jgi:hypothetical protein
MQDPNKRSIMFLLVGILLGIATVLSVLLIPPTMTFTVAAQQLSVVPLFLCLLFFFLFFLSTYIINSKIHGVLIAAFVVCYLLFRLNNLTHPLFLLLLTAIFIVLELFFSFKK